jgi:hypothetical protein
VRYEHGTVAACSGGRVGVDRVIVSTVLSAAARIFQFKTPHNHPARPTEDIAKLPEKGAKVYEVREDLEERGIDSGNCVSGVEIIGKGEIGKLLEQHDQVWHW